MSNVKTITTKLRIKLQEQLHSISAPLNSSKSFERKKKAGNVYPRPGQWCDPRGSRVFYLEISYNVNERYHIPPNEGIKH